MSSGASRYAKGVRTVYMKGRLAWEQNGEDAECPYRDVRKNDGRLTFSRHWLKVWTQGLWDARAGRPERYT